MDIGGAFGEGCRLRRFVLKGMAEHYTDNVRFEGFRQQGGPADVAGNSFNDANLEK